MMKKRARETIRSLVEFYCKTITIVAEAEDIIPKALLKQGFLEQLQNISIQIKALNENIITRENYKLTNGAMTNY
jgi:hypothetical protein